MTFPLFCTSRSNSRPNINVQTIEIQENAIQVKSALDAFTIYYTDDCITLRARTITPTENRNADLNSQKKTSAEDANTLKTIIKSMFTSSEYPSTSADPSKRNRRTSSVSLPSDSFPESTIVYLIQGPHVPRKFRPHNAIKLGVEPGHLFKKLAAGEDLELDDGRIVEAESCLEPAKKQRLIMLLDVPTVSYVQSLLRDSFISRMVQENQLTSIVHICGPGVAVNEGYTEWMKSCADGIEHIICSKDHGGREIVFKSQSKLISLMNQVVPDLFPLVKSEEAKKEYVIQGIKVCDAQPLMSLQLEPEVTFDVSRCNEKLDLKMNITNDEISIIKSRLTSLPSLDSNYKGVTVIPLGTASAIPSKYRNGILRIIQ